MGAGYAKISRDVTARQQAERALKQTLLQLEETNRRLEHREHERACSLSMTSYELLSPLTSTKGLVENLLQGVGGGLVGESHSLSAPNPLEYGPRHSARVDVIGSHPPRRGAVAHGAGGRPHDGCPRRHAARV